MTEFSSVFSAVASHSLDVDTIFAQLDRVREKLLSGDTTPEGLRRVEEVRERFRAGVVFADDGAWLAKHLVLKPVTSKDLEMLRELLPMIGFFRIAYAASQLVTGNDNYGMPYDNAILEARGITDALQRKGAASIEDFVLLKHAASSLRTMFAYIEQNDPTDAFKLPWEELCEKAQMLPLLADICELLNTKGE